MVYNFLIHFISNFNILAIDNIDDVFWWICLFFDGIVYSILAYAYNIFILLTEINFNVLSQWFAPVINRIESLILVLIMFKLGISFITYMVNPDKFMDGKKGGPGLLKNILIVVILLISYGLVFDLFNELTMLLVGYSSDYDFVVLKDIANVDNSEKKSDVGLINRLIFGTQNVPDNYGNQLSLTVLSNFISGGDSGNVFNQISNDEDGKEKKEINVMGITQLANQINEGTGDDMVSYHWPVLSNIVGIYITITIVKISIEVAIRMFKLVTLRLASPIVIITMIDDGFESKYFKDFIKVYMSEYTSLFIRILVMFLITAFISMLDGGFSSILPNDIGAITKALIFVLLIVAAFKFVNELPKLIDSIAGTKLAGEGKGSGFGKFLGGLAGTVLGAAGGFAAGIAGGAGALGTAANVIGGGVRGAQNGSKSQNVADFFKNYGEVRKGNDDRARNYSRMGGFGAYALSKGESALGIPQRQAAKAQRATDTKKSLDNMMEARRNALAETQSAHGYKYGATEDETIAKSHKTDEYRKRVANAESARVAMQNSIGDNSLITNTGTNVKESYVWDEGNQIAQKVYTDDKGNFYSEHDLMTTEEYYTSEYENALKHLDNFDKEVKEDYAYQLMNDEGVENNEAVKEATRIYDSRADKGYDSEHLKNATEDGKPAVKEAIKTAGIQYSKDAAEYTNRKASQRANRTGRYQ